MRSRLFEGEVELRGAVDEARSAASWAVELLASLALDPCVAAPAGEDGMDWQTAFADAVRSATSSAPAGDKRARARSGSSLSPSPAEQRRRLESALAAGDYTGALAALHGYFDLAYGTSLGGGSSLVGTTTAQSLLSPGLLADTALFNGPLARARELLLAASTGPPVGGTPLGRSLAHYPLLHLAALELRFGHAAAAADALRECARVAAANGDGACGTYCLELSLEVEAAELAAPISPPSVSWGSGSGAALGSGASAPRMTVDAQVRQAASVDASATGDALLRLRSRAGEGGLWRLQAMAALRLAELRWAPAGGGSSGDRLRLGNTSGFSSRAAAAARSEVARAPVGFSASTAVPVPTVAMCDWLSFDPLVSFRLGGHSVGLAGVCPPVLTGPLPWRPSPGAVVAATATAGAISAVREGTRATALASPLQALHLAHSRRVKAVTDSGGGGAGRGVTPPVPQTPATLQAALATLPAPASSAYWSGPAAPSAAEVAAMHAAAHASSARMWSAACEPRGRRTALPTQAVRESAEVCAGVALAAGAWRVPASGAARMSSSGSQPSVPDFASVLDALCQQQPQHLLEEPECGGESASSSHSWLGAALSIAPPSPLSRLPRAPGDLVTQALRVASDPHSVDSVLAAELPHAWPVSPLSRLGGSGETTSAARGTQPPTAAALFAMLGNPSSVATALSLLAEHAADSGRRDMAHACLADMLRLLRLSEGTPAAAARGGGWEAAFGAALSSFFECVAADAPVGATAVILIARAVAGAGHSALADEMLCTAEARVASLSAATCHVGSIATGNGLEFLPPRFLERVALKEPKVAEAAVPLIHAASVWRGADRALDVAALFAQCAGDGGAIRGTGRGGSFAVLMLEVLLSRAGMMALAGSGAPAAAAYLRENVCPLLLRSGATPVAAAAVFGSAAVAYALEERARVALSGLA